MFIIEYNYLIIVFIILIIVYYIFTFVLDNSTIDYYDSTTEIESYSLIKWVMQKCDCYTICVGMYLHKNLFLKRYVINP